VSTEDTRRVARAFFEHLGAGRFGEAAALRAPDSTWTLPGPFPFSGTHGVDELDDIQARLYARFVAPPRFVVHAITAEGDRAAVEFEANGHTRDGKDYHQHYHFLMIVQGGLIRHAREYLDTLQVYEVLLGGRVDADVGLQPIGKDGS
jgi:ketosteroid isomerase-like protein